MVLILSILSDHALNLYQVLSEYLIGFRVTDLKVGLTLGWSLKFAKGHNSVKNLGEVMVLVLSTLSDNVLYLYQVLSKCLIGFQSYGLEQ